VKRTVRHPAFIKCSKLLPEKVLTPLLGGELDVRGLQTFAYGVVEEGNIILEMEPEGPLRG
jgi:hypothetical protein